MRWHECATEDSERQSEQALVDEINSLPLKSCVLLESLEEFRDGTIFLEMLHAAIRIQGLESVGRALRQGPDVLPRGGGEEGAQRRVHAVIACCRQLMTSPPQELLSPDCVARICSGDRASIATLAILLCRSIEGRLKLRPVSRRPSPASLTPGAFVDVAEERAIVSWLRHIFQQPSNSRENHRLVDIADADCTIDAFSSGVLLCILIERSTSLRVPGVEPKPLSFTSRCTNFAAATAALRTAGMPCAGLRWSPATLARGDRQALWSLIGAVYRQFGKDPAVLAGRETGAFTSDPSRKGVSWGSNSGWFDDSMLGRGPPSREPLPERKSRCSALPVPVWEDDAGNISLQSKTEEVHYWLRHSFGFDAPEHMAPRRSHSSAPLATIHPLDDPLCNGTILLAVANSFCGRNANSHNSALPYFANKPRNPRQIHRNFDMAFSCLRSLYDMMLLPSASKIETSILTLKRAMRSVARYGERWPVWELLWTIMRVGFTKVEMVGPAALFGMGSDDGDLLENDLLLWLHDQRMLPPLVISAASAESISAAPLSEISGLSPTNCSYRCEISLKPETQGNEAVPRGSTHTSASSDVLPLPSLDQLMPLICSGELLCDIAARISSNTLHGVFRPPATATTAMMNIRKASERLRHSAGGGTVLTEALHEESDAKILLGDRDVALAWLRCAHRCASWRQRKSATKKCRTGDESTSQKSDNFGAHQVHHTIRTSY